MLKKKVLCVLLSSLVAGQSFAAASADYAGASARFSLISQAKESTRQAAAILASESADDADGYPLPPAMQPGTGAPNGGGFISMLSGAPKTDGTSTKLGYCAWDNGASTGATGRIAGTLSLAAPVIAVIAPGTNGAFDTTCTQIQSGLHSGDDLIVTYTAAQLRSMYSLHVGAAVADDAALSTVAPSSLRDGEIRLIKSTNALKRWDATTAAWKDVGGSGGGSGGLPDAGTALAPAYAFKTATDAGMYHTGSGLGFSVAGVPIAVLAATGLTVTGAMNATTINTTGNALVGGDLAVTGATTLTGALTANGGINTTTLNTSGNASVGGNLAVTGTTILTGALTANGGINTTTLNTSGAATVNGLLTANAGISTTSVVASGSVTAGSAKIGPVNAAYNAVKSNLKVSGGIFLEPAALPTGTAAEVTLGMVTFETSNNNALVVRGANGWMSSVFHDHRQNIVSNPPGAAVNRFLDQDGGYSPGNNVLLGQYSGRYLRGNSTDGASAGNVALGDYALENYGTGGNETAHVSTYNVAIGPQSLRMNYNGDYNIAVGAKALYNNSYGTRNVAIGTGPGSQGAMFANTTGTDNIAIGGSSLGGNQSGTNNIAIGRFSGGSANEAASYNTSIGASTLTVGLINYATALGAGSVVRTSNTIVLGRTTDITVIGAQSADAATAGYGLLQVTGNITPGTDATYHLGSSLRRWNTVYASNGTIQTSDVRLKTNVAAISPEEALAMVVRMDPVRYNWADGSAGRKVGFIAQELAKTVPEVIHFPQNEGDYYGVNYAELTAVLAGAVKAQESKLKFFEFSETSKGLTAKLAANFEALKVKAALVEAETVKAKYVQAEKINSDEREFNASNGCQPLFILQTNAVYDVRAVVAEGGWGSMRISTSASAAFVQEQKKSELNGVELQVVNGNQVCAMASGGHVKASWTRVL